jgi:hypothetical protein
MTAEGIPFLALEMWYDFCNPGSHLGNVGLVYSLQTGYLGANISTKLTIQ